MYLYFILGKKLSQAIISFYSRGMVRLNEVHSFLKWCLRGGNIWRQWEEWKVNLSCMDVPDAHSWILGFFSRCLTDFAI